MARKRFAALTALLLMLGMLGCNLMSPASGLDWRTTGTPADASESPTTTLTQTRMPMCTPPACAGDEVYYCEDECPNGCGTTCATPTAHALPLTNTSEPDPNYTSTPADTVAPTPTPSITPKPTNTKSPTYTPEALRIVTFLGSRTTINEGEEIQISWDVRGADSARIEWTDQHRTRVNTSTLALPEGLLSLKPYRGSVILTAQQGTQTESKVLNLSITCPVAWSSVLENVYPDICPTQYNQTWAAWQSFEHGAMVWSEDEQVIYVLYDASIGSIYQEYPDNFEEGDPESDPSLIPPPGYLQPIRGFGMVWRDNAFVRNALGWATAGEQGYGMDWYAYSNVAPSETGYWVSTPAGTVLMLHPYTHTWSWVIP